MHITHIPVYSVPLTDEWYAGSADGQYCSCHMLTYTLITFAGNCSSRILPQVSDSLPNDYILPEAELEGQKKDLYSLPVI